MKKRLLSFIAALALVFVLALPAFAEGYTSPVTGYDYSYFAIDYDAMLDSAHKYANVYDFADLLTDEGERDLQARADQRRAEGYSVYFVTYDDAYGRSTMTFTDDLYDYYITKLDFDKQVTGVMYAIDMDNREVYINTGGALSDSISTDKAYSLLDKTYQYASDKDYYTCLLKTDEVTMKYLNPTLLDKIIPTPLSGIISAIVSAVTGLGMFARHNRNNKIIAGSNYLGAVNVVNNNAVFAGNRREVIHDFYKQSSSGGGGGSHSSGGGGSHGGGGHGF